MPASPGRFSVAHVDAVARAARARSAGSRPPLRRHGSAPALRQRIAQGAGRRRRDQQVDAGVGGRPRRRRRTPRRPTRARRRARPAAIPARSSASARRAGRSATGSCARRASAISTWRPILYMRSSRSGRLERDAPRCRATAPPARSRGSACRRGCGPSGSAARRSSPSPGASASTSLVTWPWRNSAASGPRHRRAGRASGALEEAGALASGRGTRARARAVRLVAMGPMVRGRWSTLRPCPSPTDLQARSSTRCRATGPTSSSTCGSPTRAATSRRR